MSDVKNKISTENKIGIVSALLLIIGMIMAVVSSSVSDSIMLKEVPMTIVFIIVVCVALALLESIGKAPKVMYPIATGIITVAGCVLIYNLALSVLTIAIVKEMKPYMFVFDTSPTTSGFIYNIGIILAVIAVITMMVISACILVDLMDARNAKNQITNK